MGCDIHVIVAKHDPKTGKTERLVDPEAHYEELSKSETVPYEAIDAMWSRYRFMQGRNYKRFAKLSGVRGDGPDPNGWPDWAVSEFYDTFSCEDHHSHTHYPIKQAAKLWLETEHRDDDRAVIASVNPVAMYFDIDPERPDIDEIWVLICYDN